MQLENINRGLSLEPGEQRPGCRGDVLVTHQSLAHKESLDAGSGQTLAIGVTGYSALRDHDLPRRHLRLEPLADLERGRERAEVSVVDAYESPLESEGPFQFDFVMRSR